VSDHLEEAKKLGLNFSRYCREKDLSFHQWAWVKRALLRKVRSAGVTGEPAKWRTSCRCALPPGVDTTVCRIRHPRVGRSSVRVIRSVVVLALMSGAAA